MAMFIIGFIVGFFVCAFVLGKICKLMSKERLHASAFYDKEKDLWSVYGQYLTIADKIRQGIQQESVDGIKRVKYKN